MEEIFAMAPFVGESPSLPTLPDISLCEIGGPLKPSVPVHFYCHTQRQIFLAEAPLCAESSHSLMCFKFVSIFYGGLQPLMQMCNGSCKSALQGENTSGA